MCQCGLALNKTKCVFVLPGLLRQQLIEDAGNRLKRSLGVSPTFNENNVGTIPRSYVPPGVKHSSL